MSIQVQLEKFVEKVNNNPEHIQEEKDRVFQIDLKDNGSLQIILKDGKVEVVQGTIAEPEVTLTMSDKNFEKLLNDDLNTTMAFMTGNLKVNGSVGLALKLQDIVKRYQ